LFDNASQLINATHSNAAQLRSAHVLMRAELTFVHLGDA